MSIGLDVERRIQKSRRLLRGWDWMSLISTARGDAVAILSQEAKALVQLGPKCPGHSMQIGRLIVDYQRLIAKLKADDDWERVSQAQHRKP